MATLDDWAPMVQQIVPGVPDLLVSATVGQAIREFSLAAKVHRYNETIPSVDGQPDYDLTLPSNTILMEVEQVTYGTLGPLELTDEAWLDLHRPTWATDESTPDRYMQEDRDTIKLTPKPSVDDDDIKVWGYVWPTEDATTVDDRYLALYKDPIGWLAASLLLAMPKREDTPWGDSQRAATYSGMYNERLNRILSRGPKNQHTDKQRRAKPFLWQHVTQPYRPNNLNFRSIPNGETGTSCCYNFFW